MKTLIAAAVMLIASSAAPQPPAGEALTYRFDEVKRSVVVKQPQGERKIAPGATAASGERVKTGWFSYALLSSTRHRARFELYGSTEVVLASGTPGVVISLERGRLHAIFDKLTGTEPRVVETPGALLAVRGTEFTVDVNAKGETTVDVFAGLVEVSSPLRPEPLFVRPGESGVFSRRDPPAVVQTPPGRRHDGEHQPFGPDGRGGPGANEPRRDGGDGSMPRDGRPPQDRPQSPPQNPPHSGGGMNGGAPPPPQPPRPH